MSYIWSYLKRYSSWLMFIAVGAILFNILLLGFPTILARMIDEALLAHRIDKVYQWSGVMLLLIVIGMIGRVILIYFSSRLLTTFIQEMREDLYQKTQTYSHYEYEKIGISSLINRMMSDTCVLMQFVGQVLRVGTIAPIGFVMAILLIIWTNLSLYWILLLTIFCLIGIIFGLARCARPLSEEQQKRLDKINQYVREQLTGIRVIRAFAREDFQKERFRRENDQYRTLSVRLFTLTELSDPLFSQLVVSMVGAIFYFSFPALENGQLFLGSLVAFIQYSFQALLSFSFFSNLFVIYPKVSVSIKRLKEIANLPISIDANEGGLQRPLQGVIEFRQVDFSYPEEKQAVLHHLSFTAKPGQVTAFIGSTGSGKSSLVQLIPRFYDVTGGSIQIDGVDIREYNLKTLREQIAFIAQKSFLFTGTIAANLTYGDQAAPQTEIEEAARISQAHEFIHQSENGYQTHLEEGGKNLSGGQKQRLAIARAVLKKPVIYIFDDSFSALDYQTDAALQDQLKKVTQQATVLVVAQRIVSIKQADQIIVLDKGRIVGCGRHDELMKTNSIYREIALSQHVQ